MTISEPTVQQRTTTATPRQVTHVGAIPPIRHEEAMALAESEGQRLLALVDQLSEADWGRPTDCEGWDVKALLSHVLGSMEGNARFLRFARGFLAASRAAKRSGRPMIDEMTARQVRDHAHLPPKEMKRRQHSLAATAVRGRRRLPGALRAMSFKPGPPFEGTWTMGYLIDTIMNRDYWMHRVDLARATGKDLVLTPEHDGRIVADVVREWAGAHGQPFSLVLEGPAGGNFAQSAGGEHMRIDAVEFCRILSGRGHGSGLLGCATPF